LKLLGDGIHAFAEHNKVRDVTGVEQKPLPAARIADPYATWAAQLNPFLTAHTPPELEWDLRRSYFDQKPEARQRVLPMHFCPARPRSGKLSIGGDALKDGEHQPGSLGDYACAAGNGDPAFPWTGPNANGAIVLGEVLEKDGDLVLRWQSRTRFSALTRGQGYTILVGEKHVPPDGLGQAAFGDGSLYNGQHPASFSRVGGPGFGLARAITDPMNNNFGSYHPGICQFLMADTSVRPLAVDLSEDVLGKMITRD
jgi:hypothetical protein